MVVVELLVEVLVEVVLVELEVEVVVLAEPMLADGVEDVAASDVGRIVVAVEGSLDLSEPDAVACVQAPAINDAPTIEAIRTTRTTDTVVTVGDRMLSRARTSKLMMRRAYDVTGYAVPGTGVTRARTSGEPVAIAP